MCNIEQVSLVIARIVVKFAVILALVDAVSDYRSVFVADELALVRSGITAQVAALGLRVCGEAQTARDALDAMRQEPALIVIGSLVDDDVVNVVRYLKAPHPSPLVLVLVPSSARHGLAELLAAGADGVIRRSAAAEEVQAGIVAVLTGERFISPTLIGELKGVLTPVIDLRDGTGGAASLSAREREMLVFLSQGRTNREIAEALCLSVATVKSHLIRVYSKLEVNSRAEALGAAVAKGLLA